MADVAHVAGVSHQTVSRVLNRSGAVRAETRERVVAAMEQLNYRRNHAARALVTRRSQILGVIAFGTSFFGPSSMQRGKARGRERGWRSVLQAVGARIHPPLVGDWTPESGYEMAARLVERADLTALFAATDQMSLGVLKAFRERGVRVPEDVSIVGFDDVPEAAFYSPPLTTVAQDFRAVGTRSLEVLLKLIDGEPVEARHVIPAKLVLRASSARRA